MNQVSRIYSPRPVSEAVDDALRQLDRSVCEALSDAHKAGVPQGLIVALMSAHHMRQTLEMINGDPA